MSWHFSQALVEAYSADTCSAGAPSVPSSSTPTRGTYWSPGRTMAVSPLSRSGMTYEPSTDDRGEAVLMSYLEDFPARTSVPQERESVSPASDPACGARWQESSVKFDPASRSWKTHRCLWEEDLDWCSVTFPKWGMMLTGVLWEPTTQVPPINGTGSGLWPTIRAADGERGGRGDLIQPIRGNPNSHYKMMPTPTVGDSKSACNATANRKQGSKHHSGMTLCDHVKIWPTPQAHKTTRSGEIVNADGTPWDGIKKPHSATTGRQITSCLADAVAMWPTPCASEARQGLQIRREGKKGTQESLSTAVRMWAAPTASVGGPEPDGATGRKLVTQVGGQLNPTWVEWLMGWPLGWTDCAVSATDKFRQWQRSHGIG
jgi:hypothetical protein